jgi:hypothetical protein
MKPDLTRLYPIIHGGHKNLHNFESYHRALEEVLNEKSISKVDRENTSIDFIRSKRKSKK